MIGKLDPTESIITIQDLNDAEECKNEIIKMKNFQDKNQLQSYVQNLSDKKIKIFENYSKKYYHIIEFYRKTQHSENIYEQVIKYFKDASFHIDLDSEKFYYIDEKEQKEINYEKLIQLMNRVYFINDYGSEKGENDKMKLKRKILFVFKKTTFEFQKILELMNILRNKGYNLPIKIDIKMNIKENNPSIIYYLDETKKSFQDIEDFLLNIKNDYINRLDLNYKKYPNLRLLYGSQFKFISKYSKTGSNIEPLINIF